METKERTGNISSFVLKIFAILGMTTNHVAHVFVDAMNPIVTFVLYSFGGITYPIMAFLLVEGYLHTSNLKKYATRLFLFALVSQIPFTLLWGLRLNVLFTLLISLFLLWAFDHIRNRALFVLVALAGMGASYFCDWALQGPIIPLLFYALRSKGKRGVLLAMLVPYACTLIPTVPEFVVELMRCLHLGEVTQGWDNAAYITQELTAVDMFGIPLIVSNELAGLMLRLSYCFVGYTIALVLILKYNGQRGRPMKWFFYAYYPLHLFVIWGISKLIALAAG